jgi:hypothetical protein
MNASRHGPGTPRLKALFSVRRWLSANQARFLVAAGALLLLVAGFVLERGRQVLASADSRLGADVIVTSAGELPTLGGGILLVDKPRPGSLSRKLVDQIADTGGVAAGIPLYNIGKLSAQECPA